jgi:type I restriction enzyme R subunit
LNTGKTFNETLDELLPNNDIIDNYGKDIKWLSILTNAMRERFRELKNQYLIEEMGAKVKKLIDDYVRSFGVKVVVSEVDILDIDFKNRIKNFGSDKGQASEFRNQLKNIISTKVGVENPTLAEKLSEKLNRIIHEVHEGIMDIKKELEEYQIIRDEMLSAYEEQKNKKMNNLTYAIFTFLKGH